MKNKKSVKEITMLKYGEVIDLDGDMPTMSNLGSLLVDLSVKRNLSKRSKIKVYVSRVSYEGRDNPVRYKQKKEYSYGYLLRYWKEYQGYDFNTERFFTDAESLRESLHKIGDKRSAWTPYVMGVQMEKAQAKEREFRQALSECKTDEGREALKQKRQKETSAAQLYIG